MIVGWCIVIILHCSPGVLSGLSVHLPFCFSASRLRHESWGGVGRYVDTLSTRLTLLPLLLLSPCVVRAGLRTQESDRDLSLRWREKGVDYMPFESNRIIHFFGW